MCRLRSQRNSFVEKTSFLCSSVRQWERLRFCGTSAHARRSKPYEAQYLGLFVVVAGLAAIGVAYYSSSIARCSAMEPKHDPLLYLLAATAAASAFFVFYVMA